MIESGNQNPSQSRLRIHPRTTVRFKRKLVVAVASLVIVVTGALIIMNFGISKKTHAADAAGDYRSIMSGNWNNALCWQKYDGSNWLPTLVTPTGADGVITIASGHTITVTANVSVNQAVVVSGGTLVINAGTLTLSNGPGSDLNILGTCSLKTGGTVFIGAGALFNISNGGTYSNDGGTQSLTGYAVNNGGTYVHNVNGINIPTATWGATSTLKITGIINSDQFGFTQTFGNVIYNCTAQTAAVEFRDNLLAIQGDFTILSTGTGNIFLQRISNPVPVIISGNFLQTGGTVYMTKGAACTYSVMGNYTLTNGTFVMVERYGSPVLNVYGTYLISGGTFNHSTYNNALANEGIGTVNLYGNYVRTGGSHTETATLTGCGEFNFTKSGTQTFSASGGTITNTVNFTVVSGAILDMAENIITGNGTFTLNSGGGLILGSVNGITSSGASGNVQVTGTRSFSTGGDYTYAANAAQVTGNGLPGTNHNLTINNASDVSLTNSTSSTNLITLTNGRVITSTKELGITNTEPGSIINHSNTRYVVGNLRRSVAASGSYDFPVGTLAYYELANVSLTSMTGFTDILSAFTNENPVQPAYPLEGLTVNGTPVNTMLDYGYWTLTPNNAMAGGTYTVTLQEQGYTNPASDPNEYCVLKRNNISSYWQSQGNHTNSSQSEAGGIVTAARSALSSFSHFGIGKGGGPLPVTLVSFSAKPAGNTVLCNWITASELNNDYFTLERSSDGIQFKETGRVNGAGTSSTANKYSFTDKEPLSGVSYYRLRQTDFDGRTATFKTEKVELKGRTVEIRTIRTFPNPFTDKFTVEFESISDGAANISLTSSNGNMVFEEKISYYQGKNSHAIQVPHSAPAGIYILKVQSENLDLAPVRVIKK